jgi:hypothetical protein
VIGRSLRHGRIKHEPIANAQPVSAERFMGWAAHYAVGTGLGLYLAVWLIRTTFGPDSMMSSPASSHFST